MQHYYISIHALREESDLQNAMQVINTAKISIHALREESDLEIYSIKDELADFNPRPPRGERLCLFEIFTQRFQFQSTPSARRATLSL